MTASTASPEVLRFGPFRIDVRQRLLMRGDEIVPLEPKVADTLVALVAAGGRLVSKEELLQTVWPETFVEEGSLARNVSTLRRVLGEGSNGETYIETVPKRGYRFVAPIESRFASGAAVAPRRGGVRGSAAAVAILILLVAGVVVWNASKGPRRPSIELTHPRQVTTAVGVEEHPAWSPDGHQLAFSADPSGNPASRNWDIWIVDAAGGTPVNRTPDNTGRDLFPSWSPDGGQLAFWSDRDGGGCFVMNALAGPPRKVAAASALDPNPPLWAPDGQSLDCVVAAGDEVRLERVSLSTGEVLQERPLPGEGRRSYVTQSRDAKTLALVASPAGLGADVNQLWIVDASGEAHLLNDGRDRTLSPQWSPDGRDLFYASNAGGTLDLWRQAVDDRGLPVGSPQSITAGVMMRDFALSQDGSRIVYSQGRRVANAWRVPLLADRPATWTDAQALTSDQAFIEFLDISPDRQRLAVSSDRSGSVDIWTLPAGGGEMQRLTTDPSIECAPRWSPDGTRIAFYAFRTGNRDLWTIPSMGGGWTQVTANPGPDIEEAWSPDGAQLVHLGVVDGITGLWLTAAGGGPSRLLARAPDPMPDWNKRGGIVFGSQAQLWLLSTESGAAPRRLADTRGQLARWAPDGSRIYFAGVGDAEGNFFTVRADGTGEHAVTRFVGRRGVPGSQALAIDERYLYFTWDEDLGDLWVMDVKF